MDLSSIVVPIKRDANVSLSIPFCCHIVIFLNGILEVYSMLLAHVFDNKIFYDDCELYWSPIVCPKTGDQLALSVVSLVESLFRISLAKNPACGKPYMPQLDWMCIYPLSSTMSLSLYSLMISSGVPLMLMRMYSGRLRGVTR